MLYTLAHDQLASIFCVLQVLDAAALAAEKRGGGWLFTLDAPCFVPFMQHCRSRSLREAMYRGYLTRASLAQLQEGQQAKENKEGAIAVGEDGNNEPVIERILTLRKEKAQLLGFSNYAELSLASKMATLPEVDNCAIRESPNF